MNVIFLTPKVAADSVIIAKNLRQLDKNIKT